MSVVKEKRCPKCGLTLPLDRFCKNKAMSGGLQCWCISCTSESAKAYYIKNQDRLYTQRVEYSHSDQGQKVRRTLYLKRRYNLSIKQHKQMYIDQNGCCAVCGEAVPYGEVHTDHDHKTGEVRGLLCMGCNHMLGRAKDNPDILIRGAEYLNGLS